MRQAYTPACLIFLFGADSGSTLFRQRLHREQMSRLSGTAAFLYSCLSLFPLFATPECLNAQAPKTAPTANPGSAVTIEKALELAGQGHCKDALPTLKRSMSPSTTAETRKKAGVAGLRCALALDDRDAVSDLSRALYKQFNSDPEILFVLVHAYSDLSTRFAQDLGRKAPQSIAAHKLNAEALEMQGKWDEAQREYEVMIEKEPETPGIHFLYGRLFLSRPDAGPDATERAKQEFQKEIEIDPKNAGAHYVLGEIAAKEEKWDEAIAQFSQATKLDPNFAEAYLGWGFSLVTVKRYAEAVAPLRIAERLTPANPAVHYSLATALSRSGQREEAEKEFAIHHSLTSPPPAAPATKKPQ
jgi:tetratricopeptide (TPR) repeat protein